MAKPTLGKKIGSFSVVTTTSSKLTSRDLLGTP